jgi:hypothetical protein
MSYSRQTGDETPELTDLILTGIRSAQVELNTCMPGIVEQYSAETQRATVKFAFKRMTTNREFLTRASVEDVPVVFPRIGGRGIVFPIAKGDPVMIIFSQRSLDTWLSTGGEIDLSDTRLHNINDAIAVPGLDHLPIDPKPVADATEVRGDKILIGNTSTSDEPMVLGNELNTNLSDLITAIEDLIALITSGQTIATVPTGPAPLGAPCTSSIVTTAVETALSAVSSALSNHNSDFIFGEKSP